MPNLGRAEARRQKGVSVGPGYTLLRPRDKVSRLISPAEKEALRVYLEEHMGYVGRTPDKVQRWGRLELPDALIVRTAWKELERSVDSSKCTSRMVTIKHPGLGADICPRIGEVLYFFFVQKPNGKDIPLAMVSIGAAPDQNLYYKSFQTVMTTEFNFDDHRVQFR
ncbi:hypothetical protein NMY22_g12632 [Coprinellus aureogranulatus]|nr:hypothetical protein NMY22_g12632 [Coprinellus aureogranulatus]